MNHMATTPGYAPVAQPEGKGRTANVSDSRQFTAIQTAAALKDITLPIDSANGKFGFVINYWNISRTVANLAAAGQSIDRMTRGAQ